MRKAHAYLGVFFCLLGLAFFSSLVIIWIHAGEGFSRQEPCYNLPIASKNSPPALRVDNYGKGYFGAHRDGGRTHQGIDILAPIGQAVLASKSGRVTFSGLGKGYGQFIEIYHPDGLRTRYAHLHSLYVQTGDWVTQGEAIGACGKTGNASDPHMMPHLHFEIRTLLGAINPTSVIPTSQRLYPPRVEKV